MAFPHVSLIFRGVEHTRPSLNPFCFSEKRFCFFFMHRMLIDSNGNMEASQVEGRVNTWNDMMLGTGTKPL